MRLLSDSDITRMIALWEGQHDAMAQALEHDRDQFFACKGCPKQMWRTGGLP